VFSLPVYGVDLFAAPAAQHQRYMMARRISGRQLEILRTALLLYPVSSNFSAARRQRRWTKRFVGRGSRLRGWRAASVL